jgi:surfactin synthase thioesterase subunit
MRILPGRHFFIKDRETHFLDHLAHTLDRYMGAKRPVLGLARAA